MKCFNINHITRRCHNFLLSVKSGRKFHFITFILWAPILFSCILSEAGCKKFVEIDAPVTSMNAESQYASDASAISALTGIYATMSYSATFTANESISLMTGLSSDELTLYSGVTVAKHIAYYKNSLVSNSTQNYGSETWLPLYRIIFTCNSAIEGLDKSTSLTPSIKQQLLGEAKFLRAFFYFYLVNLYGDVPLTTITDPDINSTLSRTPKNQVYEQIVSDLTEAKGMLSENFLDGNLHPYSGVKERVRPAKWAAAALLARVYLYTGDWLKAESEATEVIRSSSLFSLSPLNNAFLKNSTEAIWQLQPVRSNRNTEDAFAFIIPSSGPSNPNGLIGGNPAYLSIYILNSFESGDKRKNNGNWVDSITVSGTTYYYPYKYKATTGSLTEYLMVLRLSEQYLIRAEARAQQNNIGGSQSDLNNIRTRAGLSTTPANDKTSLLNAIIRERQVELFTEWGHRWLDLKRTGNVDAVMASVATAKGTVWNSYQQLYPLPFTDLQRDPNLVQNTGY